MFPECLFLTKETIYRKPTSAGKLLVAKTGDLSSISGTHMMDSEN